MVLWRDTSLDHTSCAKNLVKHSSQHFDNTYSVVYYFSVATYFHTADPKIIAFFISNARLCSMCSIGHCHGNRCMCNTANTHQVSLGSQQQTDYYAALLTSAGSSRPAGDHSEQHSDWQSMSPMYKEDRRESTAGNDINKNKYLRKITLVCCPVNCPSITKFVRTLTFLSEQAHDISNCLTFVHPLMAWVC